MPRLVFSREEINNPDATHKGINLSARIKEYIMKKIVYAAIAAAFLAGGRDGCAKSQHREITQGEEDTMLSYTFRDALRYKVRSSYKMTD